MNRQKAIICDLDGTLINIEHRRHFVEGEKKDWKSFLHPENLRQDTVNNWCRFIINRVANDVKILYVTGRSENLRQVTKDWCIEHVCRFNFLFMREEGDYRQDAIIKEDIYKQYIEPQYDVVFCIDDRKSVVDMWRRLGLVCLQCAEGNF